MSESFSLIGASRVGVSLAYNLTKIGFSPEFIWNRSEKNLCKATDIIPFKNSSTNLYDFQYESKWIIISVTDDAIRPIAEKLSKIRTNFQNTKVFHLSGFRSSDILSALEEKGAITGAFHPVLSIPNIHDGIKTIKSAVFTCQGKLQNELLKITEKLGTTGIPITARQKQAIHISAVFLNNYATSLIYTVKQKCLTQKISINNIELLLQKISKQAIENGWQRKDLSDILTGPLIRGDTGIIKEHLAFLDNFPGLKKLYSDFGLLTAKKINIDKVDIEKILKIFNESKEKDG